MLPSPPKFGENCYKYIECHDLERFIVKVYGVFEFSPAWKRGSKLPYTNFSIVAMEEWGNYQEHSFTVKRERLDKWDREGLREFMESPCNKSYMLHILLTDMCNNGYIEPGEYLVSVYW